MPIQYINGIRRNVTPQGVIIPEETSAITAPILEDVKPLELPDLTPEPDYTASISAIPSMESIMAPQETTPIKQNQTDMSSRILKLYEQMGGQPAAQITAEQQAGLPQFQAQLTDINSQIQSLQKEAMAIPLQIQQQFAGRGATQAGITPIQTGLLRQNAIKALSLSAIAGVLQGNVAMAQQQADRAITLQFAPMEAEINYLNKAIELNYSKLNREDQKRAELQKIQLDERQRFLDEQKANKQNIYDITFAAAKAGADALTLNKIKDSATPEEALQIASPFLQTQEEVQLETIGSPTTGYYSFNPLTGETKRITAEIPASISGGNGKILIPPSDVPVDITKMSSEAQAVINGTLRLEDLTPTVRGKIAGELMAAGYQSGPKLSAGQQELIATMDTVSGLADQVIAYNADGKLEGIGAFGLGTLKSGLAQLRIGGEEGKNVRALIGNIKGTVAKLRGGTSFTPNEEKLLESYTPSVNDSPGVALNKLALLQSFIATLKANTLTSATERGVKTGNDLDSAKSKYNISY